MLVLSRKTGQKIRIGEHIELTIVEIRPDWIRLGIDAPRELRIDRLEVYEAIQRGKGEEAA